MADHYEASVNYCALAVEARDRLTTLYEQPTRDPREVASLNGDLGDAMKLAEIHAALAIVQQLREVAHAIESAGGVDLVGLMRS